MGVDVLETALYHEFANAGYSGNGRAFPGFPLKSELVKVRVAPREALRFDMSAEDILSIHPAEPGLVLNVLVYDDSGRAAPELMSLEDPDLLDPECADARALVAWVSANGGDPDAPLRAVRVRLDELSVLRAKGACTVWLVRPTGQIDLVSAGFAAAIEVAVKPAATSAPCLPPPFADVRDEFTVPRGTAMAYQLEPGEFVQIIDVEGQQCSDFTALRYDPLQEGLERAICSTATRSMVRSAYPGPGLLSKFYDPELRPMMRVIQDTCGRHDTFGMACTARGYEDRGFPGHLNCSDNISAVLSPYDVATRPAWPAINFFWNTWVDPQSHQILTEESHSRPGDYVVLQAMDRLVCASTACPDDLDPINGWNPTDVHVRIYRPDAPIRHAVAYREEESAPMSISAESAFHPATSQLTQNFAPARDLWAPVSFPSIGTKGEYWACREKATLQDMSSLRKYDIVGPDAEVLLQKAMTRDVSRVALWRGTYALICDEAGTVVDDGTLFHIGHDLYRWCCGTEESARVFKRIADEEGLQVRIQGMDSAMPNLALQGPNSRDILRKVIFTQPTHPALDDLKWFGVTIARLGDRDGIPFMLARSGYTGELGYELFCAASDAPALWDGLMTAGKEFGIAPMGSAALETIRIEAGLAARAEFAPGVDAYEAGLGFAVDLRKSDFVGKAALERNAEHQRRVLKGLKFQCNDVPAHGAHIYAGERVVGVVTSACRSPMFECTIAMARIAVEHADIGTDLQVGQLHGRMKTLDATVCDIPFFDPKRERARA